MSSIMQGIVVSGGDGMVTELLGGHRIHNKSRNRYHNVGVREGLGVREGGRVAGTYACMRHPSVCGRAVLT